MPDWSYRTVFQPMLFSLSAETGRDLALGAMGRLSRFPFGPTIIDLFGHMRPDARLKQLVQGLELSSPVGISCVVDPHGIASRAVARFGIGFLEVGPVSIRPIRAVRPVERRDAARSVWQPEVPVADSVEEWAARLSRVDRRSARHLARMVVAAGTEPDQASAECRQIMDRLAPHVDGFVLATSDESVRAGWSADDWHRHVRDVMDSAARCQVEHVWLAVRADLNPDQLRKIVAETLAAGCRAVLIDGRVLDREGGWIIGPRSLEPVGDTVRFLRNEFGDKFSIIAGGVHEPADALELRRRGADGVIVDSGLVYSGPGLPKRINEAILYADWFGRRPEPDRPARSSGRSSIPIQKFTWFWTWILGAAMLFGSLLAFGVATTRVILPYDEVFVGMSREELNLINPRLLAFMQHDRVSLSGTMSAVAVMYLFLSWYGIRRGSHWAMVGVLVSAFCGFVSFFFFLGFGYFDPFHAFVTAIMFQFLLLAWQGDLGEAEITQLPNLRETAAWRWGQWGQLSFVIHGVALVGAGVIISAMGCTAVFVREDLEFMDVCPSDLSLANPRLIPLIAHDRASFGGMLISTGLATLACALWGFREGARWQWWMLLLAGIPAYVTAIGVHVAVGYTNWWHLAPAYGGLTLLIIGLVLLWPYLDRQNLDLQSEWNRLLDSRVGDESTDHSLSSSKSRLD
jgi:dihydroorotate dehydrogenase